MKSLGMTSVSASARNATPASVTKGDLVWLNACRNSPVSATLLYQQTRQAAQAAFGGPTGRMPYAH